MLEKSLPHQSTEVYRVVEPVLDTPQRRQRVPHLLQVPGDGVRVQGESDPLFRVSFSSVLVPCSNPCPTPVRAVGVELWVRLKGSVRVGPGPSAGREPGAHRPVGPYLKADDRAGRACPVEAILGRVTDLRRASRYGGNGRCSRSKRS